VLALLVGAGFVFFGGGGSGGGGSADKLSIGDVELAVGEVRNENAGPPAQLPVEIQDQVMTTVGTYIEGALIDVVRDGEPARDLATVFDAGAATRLDGPDRATLLEEGLTELTGDFTPSVQPVILTGLSDGSGAFVLVSAAFTYEARAKVEQGAVKITRVTELTMVPDAGSWKITGYDVVLTRDGPGVASTTTTVASSSAGAGPCSGRRWGRRSAASWLPASSPRRGSSSVDPRRREAKCGSGSSRSARKCATAARPTSPCSSS